jgi:hypothetical protein
MPSLLKILSAKIFDLKQEALKLNQYDKDFQEQKESCYELAQLLVDEHLKTSSSNSPQKQVIVVTYERTEKDMGELLISAVVEAGA